MSQQCIWLWKALLICAIGTGVSVEVHDIHLWCCVTLYVFTYLTLDGAFDTSVALFHSTVSVFTTHNVTAFDFWTYSIFLCPHYRVHSYTLVVLKT